MNGMESAGFWSAVSIAFMQGFVGSLHCIGMCGPFVHLLNGRRAPAPESTADATTPGESRFEASLSDADANVSGSDTDQKRELNPDRPESKKIQGSGIAISSQAASSKKPGSSRWTINTMYNLMRSLSYMSVGFFLGLAGKTINLYVVNSIAAILGAALLLYFGLSFIFPSIPGFHGIRMPAWFNRSIGQLLRGRTNPVENAALMGMVSGLLPCGLLYPAYGLALGTGEPLTGAFIMFVFSLGTYPALFLVGLASSKLWDFLRARWPGKILGIIMIAYAIFIVVKRWSHAGSF